MTIPIEQVAQAYPAFRMFNCDGELRSILRLRRNGAPAQVGGALAEGEESPLAPNNGGTGIAEAVFLLLPQNWALLGGGLGGDPSHPSRMTYPSRPTFPSGEGRR